MLISKTIHSFIHSSFVFFSGKQALGFYWADCPREYSVPDGPMGYGRPDGYEKLAALGAEVQARGLRFGKIFNSQQGGATSDQAFFQATLADYHSFRAAAPAAVLAGLATVVETWYLHPKDAGPEATPFTLMNTAWAVWNETNRPVALAAPPALLPPACSADGSCPAALEAMAAQCVAAGRTSCPIALAANAVYRWPRTARVSGVSGLRIVGGGNTTVLLGAAVPAGFLAVSGVAGFALASLTIDTERPPYTFARVLATTATGFLAAFDPRAYPMVLNGTVLNYTGTVSNIYGSLDPSTLLPANPSVWGGGGPLTMVNASTVHVAKPLPAQFVGQLVVLEHTREHTAVDITESSDVNVTGVRLWGCAGFAFLVERCYNVEFAQVQIVARDAPAPSARLAGAADVLALRPMSAMADGIHITLNSGAMVIRDTRVERNGDDAFASNNEYLQVMGFPDPGDRSVVEVDRADNVTLRVGDVCLVRRRRDLVLLGTGLRVVSIDFAGRRVRFAAPLPAEVAPWDVVTPALAPAHTLLANCTLWGNLGHGARVKLPNVTIADSLLGWNSYGAVLGLPDAAFWMSSMAVTNLTLARNRIVQGDPWAVAQYDVEPASIVVTAYVPAVMAPHPSGKQPAQAAGVNANIQIVNNTLVQAPGVRVVVLLRATDTYTVTGNTVHQAQPSTQLVLALNSTRGLVVNNTMVQS